MKIYTIAQAAKELKLSNVWVNDLITNGDLKASKHGNTWLITEKQIKQYLKLRKNKGIDKKKECRQWLKEHGFKYNRQKGKSRGYWKNRVYYGVTATEAYEKYHKTKET